MTGIWTGLLLVLLGGGTLFYLLKSKSNSNQKQAKEPKYLFVLTNNKTGEKKTFIDLNNPGKKPFVISIVTLVLGAIILISGFSNELAKNNDSEWDKLTEEEKEWYRENGDTINELQEWVDDNQ